MNLNEAIEQAEFLDSQGTNGLADFIRQQSDRIRNLEKSLGFKNSGYETINLTPQLQLTDEEIWKLSDMVLNNSDVIGFARAILRKAQNEQ
jgi:hypothetical protein